MFLYFSSGPRFLFASKCKKNVSAFSYFHETFCFSCVTFFSHRTYVVRRVSRWMPRSTSVQELPYEFPAGFRSRSFLLFQGCTTSFLLLFVVFSETHTVEASVSFHLFRSSFSGCPVLFASFSFYFSHPKSGTKSVTSAPQL